MKPLPISLQVPLHWRSGNTVNASTKPKTTDAIQSNILGSTGTSWYEWFVVLASDLVSAGMTDTLKIMYLYYIENIYRRKVSQRYVFQICSTF